MSAARRIESEPSIVGELQGRTGIRDRPENRAGARSRRCGRLGPERAGWGRRCRRRASVSLDVEKQRAADAVAIPNPPGAQAAVDAITMARGRDEQAAAFEHARADKDTERSEAFAAAMERRFGEDGARAILAR